MVDTAVRCFLTQYSSAPSIILAAYLVGTLLLILITVLIVATVPGNLVITCLRTNWRVPFQMHPSHRILK